MGDDISLIDPIFGGRLKWKAEDWTDSDDRVRGGKSESYLTIEDGCAHFHGLLDIDTLGGAGFASQRTIGEDRCWDLSEYDGVEIVFDPAKADDKSYTFILKDELLPPNPENGREQSTVSWEFDFTKSDSQKCPSNTGYNKVLIPWDKFKPTYRGKPRNDAAPFANENIKRISIMMRSFFGTQQGDFSFTMLSINGIKKQEPTAKIRSPSVDNDDNTSVDSLAKSANPTAVGAKQTIWSRLFCWGYKL